MGSQLIFTETTRGAWHVLSAAGKLDAVTAPESEKIAAAALAAHERLAVDLTGTDYLSSAGLRTFLRLSKQAKKSGKAFALCGAAGMVREVLEASGMDMLLAMYGSADELP